MSDPTITVIYDNNTCREDVQSAWGFSCLIQGLEKTILFDTGGNGPLLLGNTRQLGLDPKTVELVVLSHIHGDHTGGLNDFLGEHRQVSVVVPYSFPRQFKEAIEQKGAGMVEVNEPKEILPGVYSTGVMGLIFREHSLLLSKAEGFILVTGCAHPGIVKIIGQAKKILNRDPLLVLGGFHLHMHPRFSVRRIVRSFQKLKVHKVAPCHCTGQHARQIFKEAYGNNYVEVGAGSVVRI